jgi:alpha-maltose-1-phosphate synthase
MKVVLLTREYPPEVYGGAGVHVEYLSRELDRLADVEVRCFGAPRGEYGSPRTPEVPRTTAYQPWERLAGPQAYAAALQTISVDLAMVPGLEDASILHSHTWYANLAGHFGKLVHDVPHVVTSHSLEPLRPWKVEQLGGGYAVSCFCERVGLEGADRIIAVSGAMAQDVLRTYPAVDPSRVAVVHNGIDAAEYQPDHGTEVLERFGIDPARPVVLYLGRVTRQKGLPHLLDAAAEIDRSAQLVLCAGAADTPELEAEVSGKVQRLAQERGGVVWIGQVGKGDIVQLLTNADVFVCPSIYEPLGIVNLEAMSCETPVVATATGGIPEVVVEGETGLLVPFDAAPGAGGPRDPVAFAHDIAERVNVLLADPGRAAAMGRAGRQRVLEHFTWEAAARRTLGVYEAVLAP